MALRNNHDQLHCSVCTECTLWMGTELGAAVTLQKLTCSKACVRMSCRWYCWLAGVEDMIARSSAMAAPSPSVTSRRLFATHVTSCRQASSSFGSPCKQKQHSPVRTMCANFGSHLERLQAVHPAKESQSRFQQLSRYTDMYTLVGEQYAVPSSAGGPASAAGIAASFSWNSML